MTTLYIVAFIIFAIVLTFYIAHIKDVYLAYGMAVNFKNNENGRITYNDDKEITLHFSNGSKTKFMWDLGASVYKLLLKNNLISSDDYQKHFTP